MIDNIAKFCACEMVEGDYFEFGVYRGGSFIAAYRALERQFERRIAKDAEDEREAGSRARRREIWDRMRFFAFDSFEGLPALTAEDRHSDDFREGQYACSRAEFESIVAAAAVPSERVSIVPGWFEETCTAQTLEARRLGKAAVVWLDADLHSSTRAALSLVTNLLQDGTIIVFDDWFSYRGSPYRGEQKAFREWSEGLSGEYSFHEYQRESWKRMSFIASRRPGREGRSGGSPT